MAAAVYLLCAVMSLLCAGLLLRGYLRSRARLLFWASVCFVCLTINNAMVFVDERLVPATDLSVWRTIPAVIGVAAFVYGLIWEIR
jgi:hypothetical protein